MFGGGEGNRTPVRKPLDATFSGCRVSFMIPDSGAGTQASLCGSSLMHDRYKSDSRFTFAADFMPDGEPQHSHRGQGGLKPRQLRQLRVQCCLRLILVRDYLRGSPTSTRLSHLKIPVETFTPP